MVHDTKQASWRKTSEKSHGAPCSSKHSRIFVKETPKPNKDIYKKNCHYGYSCVKDEFFSRQDFFSAIQNRRPRNSGLCRSDYTLRECETSLLIVSGKIADKVRARGDLTRFFTRRHRACPRGLRICSVESIISQEFAQFRRMRPRTRHESRGRVSADSDRDDWKINSRQRR